MITAIVIQRECRLATKRLLHIRIDSACRTIGQRLYRLRSVGVLGSPGFMKSVQQASLRKFHNRQ